MGFIEYVHIGCVNEHNQVTAPPERELEVLVIAGVATLRLRASTDTPRLSGELAEVLGGFDVDVPARSLLIALDALIRDDELDMPDGLENPR